MAELDRVQFAFVVPSADSTKFNYQGPPTALAGIAADFAPAELEVLPLRGSGGCTST